MVTTLTVCAALSSFGEEPVRILCIGDSITQGGKTTREEYTYRWPLFCMLKDEGVSFDFIGTRQAGLHADATWPDYKGEAFDLNHEGYYGAKTAEVRDKITEHLPTLAAPDIALIHLGTNDQKSEDHAVAIVNPLTEIIAQLRAKNPRICIFVGHLNFNDGPALKIRPLVEIMGKRLTTKESPVVTVHHYRNWNEKPAEANADTFDWAHPNPKGQQKMANAWLEAMRPWLLEK